MIEAKDLRIGNYINHNDLGLIQIEGIKKHHDDYAVFTSDKWVYLKNCKPIKLTEEWLVKFGFKKEEFGFLNKTDSCGRNLKLNFNTGREGYRFYRQEGVHYFHYVHQLQNLYHALTGEELTIKE